MKRKEICPGSLVMLTALVFATAVPCAFASPFAVEANNTVAAAFDELKSRYPDVSIEDVRIESPVFFNCHTKSNIDGAGAMDASGLTCMATVNFDVSDTAIEYYFGDKEGNCLLQDPPPTAMVHLRPDDSNHLHFSNGDGFGTKIVACDEEVIARMAAQQTKTQPSQASFEVDAAAILEVAFAAAVDSFEKIPPEKFVYGDGPGLSVACAAQPEPGGTSSLDVEIGPCSALVMLANESVKLEYRYIDGISCMIGKATDWIKVNIDEFGNTETIVRRNSGGGNAIGVECNDEFYNSPLPLITSAAESGVTGHR